MSRTGISLLFSIVVHGSAFGLVLSGASWTAAPVSSEPLEISIVSEASLRGEGEGQKEEGSSFVSTPQEETLLPSTPVPAEIPEENVEEKKEEPPKKLPIPKKERIKRITQIKKEAPSPNTSASAGITPESSSPKEGAGSPGEGTGEESKGGVQRASPASLVSDIAQWIARYKYYPRLARQRGEQGTVLIRISVAEHGELKHHQIIQSSGSRELDEAAETIVERAAPFPSEKLAQYGQEVTLDVPLVFSLA